MNLKTSLGIAGCALALAGLAPTPAKACGGFFCNNTQPVNQAAERIIFSQNADGTTTAVIQIQYSGPSEEFAWMLPVQGSPEIGVSSNSAFAALQQATNPTYQLQTEVEGSCQDDGFLGGRGGSPTFDSAGAADSGAAPSEPEVSVVDAGSVGPYDFVIISVNPDAEDIATVATDWLVENEYDVSPLGRDRLVPYLESGMNLLAFRLSKGRDAGEIRPVMLSFGEGLPSIPLRPTAAAADPDMGIMVWVLGESRSIPANYRSLELNEARINWFQPSTNYNDVVTLAANEAGGQGFVTEFAGDAAGFEATVLPPSTDDAFANLSERDWTGQHRDLVVQATQLFQSFQNFGPFGGGTAWDGVAESVLAEVPRPADVPEDQWIASPLEWIWNLDDTVEGFDPASFLARLEADVLEPVRATAALFESAAKVTRFYTTMSPDEMTVDPVFDFNADLPDYSNAHLQTRIIECNPSVSQFDAPWRIQFDDGTVVRGDGQTWPLLGNDALPANRRVLRVGTEGEGEVIIDNSAAILAVVNVSNADHPRRDGRMAGGTCSALGGAAPLGVLGAFGLSILAIRRRRA
ncbi:MAG: DUF2330 domain-containing protein [Myxococcota bacterium]